MFSNTLMPLNGCGMCNDREMPIRQRAGASAALISCRLTTTRPASGLTVAATRFNSAWPRSAAGSTFVTASVSDETFQTSVATSYPGPNRFRVVDTDSGLESNEVTITIG